ncbi:MAG: metallophosphoesterase [Marinobacter sp.]|nr:metallophosphoesterase [Marinobacter sp.]
MVRSRAFCLALGATSLLLAGCNGSSDSAPPDEPGIEQPGTELIPPPVAESQPGFIVHPYLQSPGHDTMTVMFETAQSLPEVWARPFGSGESFVKVSAETTSTDGLVYRAPLRGLESNTLYEYFVLTQDAEQALRVSQPYAFKTWPRPGDGVEQVRIIALSDTQLDRNYYEVVLSNVVAEGFLREECDGEQPHTCAENIAAITISGDVVQVGGNRSHWREQLFGRMAAITPYVPLVTVPGNHDYYSNAELELYKTYMSPPDNGSVGFEKHWYYLDYLDLRLVGLDSYPISGAHGLFNRETLAVQRQWLREVLRDAEQADKPFVMGMFHHGCLSELWNVGESIGSCELVAELEQYSQRTGHITGHFFGHTHAYSRGQSMDALHLWLNAASVSGYIEPLDDAGHQNGQIRDYDTFEISRSEFGYNVLTYTFGSEPSMTLVRKKGGYDGDTDFAVVDEVTFRPGQHNNLPLVTAGTGEMLPGEVVLGIDVGAPEQVREVQWQLAENPAFDGVVFDIWGNDTRRQNLFYDAPDQVGGDKWMGFEAIDTQQFVDIFQLDLSTLAAQKTIRVGGDDYFRWTKRFASQNTHVSAYDSYSGQQRPTLILKPGTTYYWRARVRDQAMNWSAWSSVANFEIGGNRTENLLVNGDAEAGNLTGWTIEAGRMSAITASNNGGFGAAEGSYYFTGRGFGQGQPGDCCLDLMSQVVDLGAYSADIDAGTAFLELTAMMTTWENRDQPQLRVEALAADGSSLPWSGAQNRTSNTVKSWELRQIADFLPAGTRAVKVFAGGERKQGNDNDVYFDDINLRLFY